MVTKEINCGRVKLPLNRTLVMGILNVTPDSVYAGTRKPSAEEAVEHGKKLAEDGADILDVGGESTRPGSDPVSVEEELSRVIPVIEELSAEVSAPISVDSYKVDVVEKALKSGASMINDVYGLRTPGMAELVARADVPVIIMHMKGTPKNMQENPTYGDVVGEIKEFFTERIEVAQAAGVKKEKIILDPGIGFGKTLEHNLEIIRRLAEFRDMGYPILVGPSRKSFIGAILDLPPEQRLYGTLSATAVAIANGADIVRVHDVAEVVQAGRVADAIIQGKIR